MSDDKGIRIGCGYLQPLFQDTPGLIKCAEAFLRDVDFNTFVVRGLSGAVAGGILAHAMDKHLLVVRKGESTHSTHQIEGTMPFHGQVKWIFLDDFICSGRTRDAVSEALEENKLLLPEHVKLTFAGSFVYNEMGSVHIINGMFIGPDGQEHWS